MRFDPTVTTPSHTPTCSDARRRANAANARRSTGPRSPTGKARSSQNAYRHGLYARARVVAACEEAGFRDWLGQWHDDYRPDGTAETNAIDRAAHASWKLRRCAEVEAATLDKQRRGAARRRDDEQRDRADLLGR